MTTEDKEKLRKEFDEAYIAELDRISVTDEGTEKMIDFIFNFFYSKLSEKQKEIEERRQQAEHWVNERDYVADQRDKLQEEIERLTSLLEQADELITHPSPSSNNWDKLYDAYTTLRKENKTTDPTTLLTDYEFIKMVNSFYGDDMDNINQLPSVVLDGNELKDFAEHCISQFQQPTQEKEWCVSCEQEKEVHNLCLDCARKLGYDNPPKDKEPERTAEELRGKIMNAFYSGLQWNGGEITGYDMLGTENKVRNILQEYRDQKTS